MTTFPAQFNLSDLDGQNGFILNEAAPQGASIFPVSRAGDFNGDDIDDVIIGALSAGLNGDWSGASYVVFGHDQGFSRSIDLATLDGHNGVVINGVAAGDLAGRSVSGAGDINGDGIDDVIIGATGADSNGTDSGASYVVFGNDQDFPNTIDLATLDGRTGFVLNGVAAEDFSGQAVSGVGDINDDGIDDLIIGAMTVDANGMDSGANYVVFGSDQSFPRTIDLSTLDGSNGFVLNGVAAGDLSGGAVSEAGDINGDGIDDLIVNAAGADSNGTDAGASYVVFGNDQGFSRALDLAALDGGNGFVLHGVSAGDLLGSSVSGAGDINGDGIDDMIIGAMGADANGINSGASYVVFGNDQGFPHTTDLATLDGCNGFALNGVAAENFSGYSVSGAGDINGDGLDDVIIGARNPRVDGVDSGARYVVFGNDQGFPRTIDLATLDGRNGFTLNGAVVYGSSGESVSGAGDINGDGVDDLIVSAPAAVYDGMRIGAIYIVFGRTDTVESSFSDFSAIHALMSVGNNELWLFCIAAVSVFSKAVVRMRSSARRS